MDVNFYKNQAKNEISNFNWFLMFIVFLIISVLTTLCSYVVPFIGGAFAFIFTISLINVSLNLHNTKSVDFEKLFSKEVFEGFWNKILFQQQWHKS